MGTQSKTKTREKSTGGGKRGAGKKTKMVATALIVRKTMSLTIAHVYTVHGVFSIMIRTPLSV